MPEKERRGEERGGAANLLLASSLGSVRPRPSFRLSVAVSLVRSSEAVKFNAPFPHLRPHAWARLQGRTMRLGLGSESHCLKGLRAHLESIVKQHGTLSKLEPETGCR